MKTHFRKFGNSQGIIIPKSLIQQFGFGDEVEMKITPEGIMLSKPVAQVRANWAQASQQLAVTGDDELVWPEIPNADDENIVW